MNNFTRRIIIKKPARVYKQKIFGTADNPYKIDSLEDLRQLVEHVNENVGEFVGFGDKDIVTNCTVAQC